MAELDVKITQLIDEEIGKTDVLESCTAGTSVSLPAPWRFLMPVGVIGFALLSLATGIGLLSLVSLGLIVFGLVHAFRNYRRYVLVATDRHLVMIQVGSNLSKRLATRKIPYSAMLLCSETGSGAGLHLELHGDETIDLMLGVRERGLSDSAARANRLSGIVKTRCGQSA